MLSRTWCCGDRLHDVIILRCWWHFAPFIFRSILAFSILTDIVTFRMFRDVVAFVLSLDHLCCCARSCIWKRCGRHTLHHRDGGHCCNLCSHQNRSWRIGLHHHWCGRIWLHDHHRCWWILELHHRRWRIWLHHHWCGRIWLHDHHRCWWILELHHRRWWIWLHHHILSLEGCHWCHWLCKPWRVGLGCHRLHLRRICSITKPTIACQGLLWKARNGTSEMRFLFSEIVFIKNYSVNQNP